MVEGFVKVDQHTFYAKIWPKIKSKVEAVKSNLDRVKQGVEDDLLIHWGYKEAGLEEPLILAVTHSVQGKMDEYWVVPSLL